LHRNQRHDSHPIVENSAKRQRKNAGQNWTLLGVQCLMLIDIYELEAGHVLVDRLVLTMLRCMLDIPVGSIPVLLNIDFACAYRRLLGFAQRSMPSYWFGYGVI